MVKWIPIVKQFSLICTAAKRRLCNIHYLIYCTAFSFFLEFSLFSLITCHIQQKFSFMIELMKLWSFRHCKTNIHAFKVFVRFRLHPWLISISLFELKNLLTLLNLNYRLLIIYLQGMIRSKSILASKLWSRNQKSLKL